jgi:hypothetical protein
MFAVQILEHLDVVENVLSSFICGCVGYAYNPFTLQEVEEAHGDGVGWTSSQHAANINQSPLPDR